MRFFAHCLPPVLSFNNHHIHKTKQQKIYLLRSSKNAFIMQSKSTFLEFLKGIHRYKFGPPKKFFRGEIIQGKWHNFHQARALYLTQVLTCILVCFLVEFDLLVAFGVLSCRILGCASLFIYVHEHDHLCFPMLTEETADCICWHIQVATEKVSLSGRILFGIGGRVLWVHDP